jgi:hypothetical protein
MKEKFRVLLIHEPNFCDKSETAVKYKCFFALCNSTNRPQNQMRFLGIYSHIEVKELIL